MGSGRLLLSSEDLDRARAEDRAGLRSALGDHEVTLVLTATRPVHRWCSGWQTLVRHGLAEYPADATRHVLDFAALRPGRLEELTKLVPGRSLRRSGWSGTPPPNPTWRPTWPPPSTWRTPSARSARQS